MSSVRASRRFGFGLVLCALPWTANALADEPSKPKVETVLPVAEYEYDQAGHIELRKILLLKREAMQGSVEAAVKLAWFYRASGDSQERARWLAIAVENGDDGQRLELAEAYSDWNTVEGRERARFWYKKILADKSAEFADVAKVELDALEKEWKEKPLP